MFSQLQKVADVGYGLLRRHNLRSIGSIPAGGCTLWDRVEDAIFQLCQVVFQVGSFHIPPKTMLGYASKPYGCMAASWENRHLQDTLLGQIDAFPTDRRGRCGR